MIDIDTLLYGNPTRAQVSEFFHHGEFSSEEEMIQAVERHLLTGSQKRNLEAEFLTVESVLFNRRLKNYHYEFAKNMRDEWNRSLCFDTAINRK